MNDYRIGVFLEIVVSVKKANRSVLLRLILCALVIFSILFEYKNDRLF